MRNEDDPHVEFIDKFLHQVEYLRLDRHIQSRRRFIGDQKPRLGRKRHGDHRPLAHAARQLKRILIDPARRVGNADAIKHFDRNLARLRLAHIAMKLQLLDHLLTDAD